MSTRLDLTKKRFGRLVAIRDAGVAKNGSRLWLCQCDCGNTCKIRASNLVDSNHTRSCGCIRKRKLGEAAFNSLYSKMKNLALRRGFIWSITKDDVLRLSQENCIYCGRPPKQVMKNRSGKGDYFYNGIDRVDNTQGYLRKNCVPCCIQCNQAKSSYSLEEFHLWIINVYHRLPWRKS